MLVLKEKGMKNGTVTSWRYKSDVAKRWNTHLDGGAMFGVVPKVLWSRKYKHNDTNHIYLRTDPLLYKRKMATCSLILV